MFTIDESINEFDELEKIINKIPFTKNRNTPIINKLTRNKSQTYLSKEQLINKKSKKNKLYNFSLSYLEKSTNKSNNMNDSDGIDSTHENFYLNYNYFRPGNLIFEIFINISEFDEDRFDFYVSYSNLCCLLKEINIIDKKLYTDVIIKSKDLDIILKTIKKNNNSSKKLNFKEFVKFFSYLIYQIDYWHFVDKPKRTFYFNINKFFGEYFKGNKMSFISLIYNYVLYLQQETNINVMIKPIISNIKNLFINFNESNEENLYILNENENQNIYIRKNKFKKILNIMKYIGFFPNLVNIKELVIMYYIQLDDDNDNKYLNIEELNLNNDINISFKKFCQYFLCLCFYIKSKKHSFLNQFSYLLKEEKKVNFFNELKYGQKEGIIRFILNLQNKKIPLNNIQDKSNYSQKFFSEIENLEIKDIDFLFKIFESFSSHFDKYLNYQISFSDIIILFKENKFLINNNNKNSYLALENQYHKAKNRINNNISSLKNSLHSLDKFIKGKNGNNKNIWLNNNRNTNYISLRDVEIFYCKVSKRADINNRLNFKEFVKFLYLTLDKLGFNSINELFEYFYNKRKSIMKSFQQRNDELKKINILYYEVKSNEIFNIIQQISPIINVYFLSFTNKINKYSVTFDIFIKIFTELDLYPKIIGNIILRNIFYEIYQIKIRQLKIKEKKIKIFEEVKEIDFGEILMAIGVITFYLKNMSNLDEKKILLGLFFRIAESKKINLDLNFNFNFSDVLKNKLIEISNLYFGNSSLEESEYKLFLKNPFI